MEKRDLKYLLSNLGKTAKHKTQIELELKYTKNPNQVAMYKRLIETANNKLQWLSQRVDEYGTGLPMVQVTGLRNIEISFQVFQPQSFAFFLYGVDVEEAKIIMRAQTLKLNLIENTLEFNTLEFRKYYTTQFK